MGTDNQWILLDGSKQSVKGSLFSFSTLNAFTLYVCYWGLFPPSKKQSPQRAGRVLSQMQSCFFRYEVKMYVLVSWRTGSLANSKHLEAPCGGWWVTVWNRHPLLQVSYINKARLWQMGSPSSSLSSSSSPSSSSSLSACHTDLIHGAAGMRIMTLTSHLYLRHCSSQSATNTRSLKSLLLSEA